jgi:ABC-type multidrug transport system permease subunit
LDMTKFEIFINLLLIAICLFCVAFIVELSDYIDK